MRENKMRLIAAALAVVALVAVVSLILTMRTASDRADRITELTDDLETVSGERDRLDEERDDLSAERNALSIEAEQTAAQSALAESRWLAAVAISGDHSPAQSRLLAVEAATRSPSTESTAALGQLLFADARSQPPIDELEHDGPVWVTATASSADIIATGSDDATVKLWSTTGNLLTTLAHGGRVRALEFSGNDQFIATGTSGGDAVTWTVAGEQIASAKHGEQVNAVAITDDGDLMISAGNDGAALVTDTTTGQTQHELQHGDFIWTVALSADERQIATGGQDGMARVWDLDSGTELAAYDLEQPVTSVNFSPDGLWLFIGGQRGNAFILDVATGDAGPALEGAFPGGVLTAEWHPDDNELAVVSLGALNRYDLPSRSLAAAHSVAGGIRDVAYNADGSWLAVASGDFQFSFGQITFWDTESGTELVGLNIGGPFETIAVHPTGVAVAGFRATSDLVEVGGGRLVPGPDHWIDLACAGTEGVISEGTWSQVGGESVRLETGCP